MIISLAGSGPIYQRIYRSIRELILSGHLAAGTRLPVTRELARELKVSRNVVLLAYEELVAEGYALGRVGSGTYVNDALPDLALRARKLADSWAPLARGSTRISKYGQRLLRLPNNDPGPSPRLPYDFFYGRVRGDDFPLAAWRKIAVRRLNAPPLGYTDPAGDPRLRNGIAAYLRAHRGVECDAGQVVVVNGTLQALDIATRLLLNPGDRVALEDPHYTVAREVFLSAGMRISAIPVDGDGLLVDRLVRDSRGIRCVLVTPSHQFPSGAILSLQRRLALLTWAAKANAYVIEDDYDSEFRYDSRPIEALQGIDRGQRVIYIGTFSRSLFPALRLGYIVAPRPLVPLFSRAKELADRHSAPWTQQVLADFIAEGHLDRHLRKCRARMQSLRDALLESIGREFDDRAEISGSESGMHVLLRLRGIAGPVLPALIEAAARQGVGIHSARSYYLKPPKASELIIGYGAMSEDEIRAGVRILVSVLDRLEKQS